MADLLEILFFTSHIAFKILQFFEVFTNEIIYFNLFKKYFFLHFLVSKNRGV